MPRRILFDSDDDDHHQRNKRRSWIVVILSWWKKEGGKQSLQLAGAAFATALLTAAYRFVGTRNSNYMTSLVAMLTKHFQKRRGLSHQSPSEAPLSLLWNEAKLGRVQRALLSPDSISYQVDGKWQRSFLPSASMHSTLVDTLAKNGCTDVAAMPASLWDKLATPALAALPFVYLYFVYRIMRNMSGSDDKAETHDNIKTKTTFNHVAGIDSAVREVSELVTFLKHPHQYTAVGARAPRGVLLYGPPGSGKTLLARAVAGEANCGVFVACCGSDFCDTYVGRGASRVRKLFHQARTQASRKAQKSAIIFIDEIDALAKARSSSAYLSNDERDQTLNQLLTCMDGFRQDDNVTLIVIAATNRPDILDPALLRRMDRQVSVGLPNAVGRQAILQIHARSIQCNDSEVDWNYLARNTEAFSGAELQTVVNEAALLAVRQRGDMVQQHHLIQAVQKVHEMKGALRRGSPLVPR